MSTTGSTTIPFKFLWRKTKDHWFISEFGRIGYITKRYKLEKKITDKTFKSIMFGYTENHTRDTYKL